VTLQRLTRKSATHGHREERYSKEESFDWFKTYEDLKPLLSQHISSKDARILMLGCGNSST